MLPLAFLFEPCRESAHAQEMYLSEPLLTSLPSIRGMQEHMHLNHPPFHNTCLKQMHESNPIVLLVQTTSHAFYGLFICSFRKALQALANALSSIKAAWHMLTCHMLTQRIGVSRPAQGKSPTSDSCCRAHEPDSVAVFSAQSFELVLLGQQVSVRWPVQGPPQMEQAARLLQIDADLTYRSTM